VSSVVGHVKRLGLHYITFSEHADWKQYTYADREATNR